MGVPQVLDTALEDPRLLGAQRLWLDFIEGVGGADAITVIHHGDLDGAIGGCYAHAVLQKLFGGLNLSSYWVGTDEYDFVELREWVSARRPDQCLFFDMSIANHTRALAAIASSVRKSVFIFDHHLLNHESALPENVTLANPTPAPQPRGAPPVPTFLFALRLARANGLAFPDWLLALVMFAEGVDGFFVGPLGALAQTVPELQGTGDLRERYRASPLSRAAVLIRAAYAAAVKDDAVLTLLGEVAAGDVREFSVFRERLEARFGRAANDISAAISSQVEQWSATIDKGGASGPLVVIPVQGPHAVAGPVISILRGKFPEKVIMGWIEHGTRRVVELRTGNSRPINLVSLLRKVGEKIGLLNYGGHPTAAGATVKATDLELFIRELNNAVAEAYRANGLM